MLPNFNAKYMKVFIVEDEHVKKLFVIDDHILFYSPVVIFLLVLNFI